MKSFLEKLENHTKGSLDVKELVRLHRSRLRLLQNKRFARYKTALHNLKDLKKSLKLQKKLPQDYTIKNHVVRFGDIDNLSKSQQKIFLKNLKAMMPWRKGPFEIFGHMLDAEWRSDLKWERLKKHIGPLQGRTVLDIGCNNGYYLYLMAKQKPKFIFGIDPTLPYYCQFQALKTFCKPQNVDFGLNGVEHLDHFEKVFDVMFCLGILYHHTDPIGILRKMFKSLRPGGLLVVEAMGIPGKDPLLLLPQSRYLGMPGHWFIPTRSALENLLKRAGFQYIETFFETPMEIDEQRATEWAPYDSYQNGLDPKNSLLTKEGYPAPMRFYMKARRARKRF